MIAFFTAKWFDLLMSYPAPLAQVIARINKITPVSDEDYDGSGEWVYIESDDLWDHQLLDKIRRNWSSITGQYAHDMAVYYCQGGPDSGVWLHHLSTPELRADNYCGCHQLPSWY
jgi:hypothetical protein